VPQRTVESAKSFPVTATQLPQRRGTHDQAELEALISEALDPSLGRPYVVELG